MQSEEDKDHELLITMNDKLADFANKTDKSKTSHLLFGRKALMDKTLPPLFLGQFLF
jgi:hypothetical protein